MLLVLLLRPGPISGSCCCCLHDGGGDKRGEDEEDRGPGGGARGHGAGRRRRRRRDVRGLDGVVDALGLVGGGRPRGAGFLAVDDGHLALEDVAEVLAAAGGGRRDVGGPHRGGEVDEHQRGARDGGLIPVHGVGGLADVAGAVGVELRDGVGDHQVRAQQQGAGLEHRGGGVVGVEAQLGHHQRQVGVLHGGVVRLVDDHVHRLEQRVELRGGGVRLRVRVGGEERGVGHRGHSGVGAQVRLVLGEAHDVLVVPAEGHPRARLLGGVGGGHRGRGGRSGLVRRELALEVQVGLVLGVEEHRHELDPLGAGHGARVAGGIEHDVLGGLARAGAPAVREHARDRGVVLQQLGPVGGVVVGPGAACLPGDERLLLQLLQARRVHGSGVQHLHAVQQAQHLDERHGRRGADGDAGQRHGEVHGGGGDVGAVGVRRGLGGAADGQDVRLARARRGVVGAADRLHHLE
mmetsp:Transcript_34846/g.85324  ORF Transcript_34846/g.85324 Transcript_34846/m.85324 type:complete len:463 (+) Transcript_34846:433-1821(+)